MNNRHINNVLFLSTADGEPISVLYIPRGQGRFRQMGNDTEGAALIVYLSDKAAEPGWHTYEELWNDQSIKPVFGIHIETAAQAHVWAKQFEYLAKSLESKEATNGQS